MKALICSPVIPWPMTAGLKVRVFNLARELAARNDIHLFCLATEPPAAEQVGAVEGAGMKLTVAVKPRLNLAEKLVRYSGRLLQGVPPRFILSWEGAIMKGLESLLQKEDFDVAVAEHLFMARFAAALDLPVVLVEHNVESLLEEEVAAGAAGPAALRKRLAARWTARYERRMLSRMDGVIAASAPDARALEPMSPGRAVYVVENGVRADEYAGLAARDNATGHGMLFIGLMSYEPNAAGVKWFAREIMPLIRSRHSDASFDVVGAGPPPDVRSLSEDPGVSVRGFADDIRPHYRGNSVMVVPLLAGGGSRLKILEAFAAGMPVVSTSKGAEGLDVRAGHDLLIADSPGDFAAAAGRLFDDRDLYGKIRDNALKVARTRYDWAALSLKMEEALKETASLRAAGSSKSRGRRS